MLSKIKGLLTSTKDSLSKIKFKGTSMLAIHFVLFYYFFVMTLYIIAWSALWYMEGKPDLKALIEIVACISAPAVLASLTFFSKASIDRDGDNISDMMEKELDEDKEDNKRR